MLVFLQCLKNLEGYAPSSAILYLCFCSLLYWAFQFNLILIWESYLCFSVTLGIYSIACRFFYNYCYFPCSFISWKSRLTERREWQKLPFTVYCTQACNSQAWARLNQDQQLQPGLLGHHHLLALWHLSMKMDWKQRQTNQSHSDQVGRIIPLEAQPTEPHDHSYLFFPVRA